MKFNRYPTWIVPISLISSSYDYDIRVICFAIYAYENVFRDSCYGICAYEIWNQRTNCRVLVSNRVLRKTYSEPTTKFSERGTKRFHSKLTYHDGVILDHVLGRSLYFCLVRDLDHDRGRHLDLPAPFSLLHRRWCRPDSPEESRINKMMRCNHANAKQSCQVH